MKRPLLMPIAVAFAVAMTFGVPHQAFADNIPPTEKPPLDEKRCTIAKGRIANIADTMKMVSERRATTYANIYERATARAAVLKKKSYDTAKLDASLATLNKQIAEYRPKTEQLYTLLATTRDVACDSGEAAYDTSLADARTQLKAVREAADAIHKTLRADVAVELRAAAAWTKKN